jgi:hypothetical protein
MRVVDMVAGPGGCIRHGGGDSDGEAMFHDFSPTTWVFGGAIHGTIWWPNTSRRGSRYSRGISVGSVVEEPVPLLECGEADGRGRGDFTIILRAATAECERFMISMRSIKGLLRVERTPRCLFRVKIGHQMCTVRFSASV